MIKIHNFQTLERHADLCTVAVQVQQVVLASRQYSPRLEVFNSLAAAAHLPEVRLNTCFPHVMCSAPVPAFVGLLSRMHISVVITVIRIRGK